jgi:hypothetical protein
MENISENTQKKTNKTFEEELTQLMEKYVENEQLSYDNLKFYKEIYSQYEKKLGKIYETVSDIDLDCESHNKYNDNTFEKNLVQLMEKFLTKEQLLYNNLIFYKEIYSYYEKKVNALSCTKKLREYCKNKYDINLNELKIIFCESHNNCNNINKFNIDKYDKLDINFNDLFKFTLLYEIVPDRFNNRSFYHKFCIDGNLILKKEHNKLSKSFINLSCLKEFIDDNKFPLNIDEFLDSFITLIDVKDIFDDLLLEIKNNHEKYYFEATWSSDSDISSVDEKEEDK